MMSAMFQAICTLLGYVNFMMLLLSIDLIWVPNVSPQNLGLKASLHVTGVLYDLFLLSKGMLRFN